MEYVFVKQDIMKKMLGILTVLKNLVNPNVKLVIEETVLNVKELPPIEIHLLVNVTPDSGTIVMYALLIVMVIVLTEKMI